MTSVEELYKNYGLLADAGDGIAEHSKAYEAIIGASKGSAGEKKLAAGFITKFFRHFPSLHDVAIDALVDLIEDEDPIIRRSAIKSLPDVCKGADDMSLCSKITDVLTQLLLNEDPTDLGLVKSSMAVVLQLDTPHALSGVFDQIFTGDEAVREKAIEYISTSLMSMRHKLFLPHPENEKCLLELIKKVLADVTGDEFETMVDVISKLQLSTTAEGLKEVSAIISQQADLGSEFNAQDTEFIDKFITCFKHALKFCKHSSTAAPFLEYLSTKILPSLSTIEEEQTSQQLLQLFAEGCLHPVEEGVATTCILPTFNTLIEHMPLPPDDDTEQPKLQFSAVECLLFSFHKLVSMVTEFLSADENADRFKDFKQRLQYFARGSQTYHAQLAMALKGKNALELKDEQNKLRSIAVKTTANINTLIKDFFHKPPSYKATVQLSWGVKKPDVSQSLARKRPTSEGASPAKRKPSPIRFESSSSTSTSFGSKRESINYYTPPKDRFSKGVTNGAKFDDGGGRGSWRGGRGRGRGFRSGRGRRGGWRQSM